MDSVDARWANINRLQKRARQKFLQKMATIIAMENVLLIVVYVLFNVNILTLVGPYLLLGYFFFVFSKDCERECEEVLGT